MSESEWWLWTGLALTWVIVLYLNERNARLREENARLQMESFDMNHVWKETYKEFNKPK